MKRVLSRKEVIEALKSGDYILWLGGANFSACLGSNFSLTVRHDTIRKLWKEGLVTDYGYPQLSGKIYWKRSDEIPKEISIQDGQTV